MEAFAPQPEEPAAEGGGEPGELDGTWISKDGKYKLVFQRGAVTEYLFYDERYHRSWSARTVADGEALRPVSDMNGSVDLLSSYIKQDKLLISSTTLLDGPTVKMEFAREGDDFPAEPVFAKDAEDVKERRLTSFKLYSCGEKPGQAFYADIPRCMGVRELSIKFKEPQAPEGLPVLDIEARGDLDPACRPKRHGALTEELEAKLTDLLLAPEVLAINPYKLGAIPGMQAMSIPKSEFALRAELTSGEKISIESLYGVPDAVRGVVEEIARLILSD